MSQNNDVYVRPGMFDSKFNVVTLEEAIEYLKGLNIQYPNINKIGMNIELKCAQQYLDDYGINVSEMLYETLKKHNLHTREAAIKSNLPIIIQSFDEIALRHFK